MRKGLTTLELIVAFCVLALLTGIANVSFLKLFRLSNELSFCALSLAQDIRDLQLSAMMNKDYSRLYIDLIGRKRYIKVYPGSRSVERTLPGKVRISSSSFGGSDYLSFSPSGAPLNGGYIALTDGRRRLYVIVAVTTGRVRISERLP